VQDYLTTVVEQDNAVSQARVTGSMVGFVEPGNGQAIVERLADPAIRIVSLTITEGGYFMDPASGHFNPQHPAILADAAHPDDPKTVFGLIVAGIKRRSEAGTAPFTVMSCDNIPGNGHVARAAVAGLAAISDPGLATYILSEIAFPNSMVDRITPATGAREIERLHSGFGLEDHWPVFCEAFRQWVLEDHFPNGRPALEDVGVTFVADVAPYELMKLRILNGGHEAMENPLIRAFLAKLEREEIIPVVPPVPNTDLRAYFAQIERRFLNPKIADTIPRLCQDGSNRQPKFILPSTADRLRQGMDVTGLALVSALWCRYCAGTSDSGRAIPANDGNAELLKAHALKARENPQEFLAMSEIFGDVGTSAVFGERFATALAALWTMGTAQTLTLYSEGRLS
jgi:mannitol 2-dehydrogenase